MISSKSRRQILSGALTSTIAFSAGQSIAQSENRSGIRKIPTTGQSSVDLKPFDEMMVNLLTSHGIPGASFALSRHGQLIYRRGYGFADLEKGIPVDPDALFRIASVSKSLTAVAILKLAEEDKVHLDDPALMHVRLTPHLESGRTIDPRWKSVALRNLLQHSGGWDRKKTFDPIVRAEAIAKTLGISLPVQPNDIIR